jgi:surface antigen
MVPAGALIGWPACSHASTGFGYSPSTELAWEERADIVQAATEVWYDLWVASGFKLAELDWDATYWDANAAAVGIPVGTRPQPNAIMVYHSSDVAVWPGHVAYVESVNPNGSFLIEQMHAPALYQVDQVTVTPKQLIGANIDFIY